MKQQNPLSLTLSEFARDWGRRWWGGRFSRGRRVLVKVELCLDFVDEVGNAGTINVTSTQLDTTGHERLMKEGESSNGKRTNVNHFSCLGWKV
jgi:hypothetical protein